MRLDVSDLIKSVSENTIYFETDRLGHIFGREQIHETGSTDGRSSKLR